MAGNKKPKAKAAARKRPQSHTPILLWLDPKQTAWLKAEPRHSLGLFEANRGSAKAWHNLLYRVKVGLELAKLRYTEETVGGFEVSVQAAMAIYRRAVANEGGLWQASPEEIELIRMGLDAADTMQDETLRRDQLTVYRQVDAFMKAII